MYILCQGWLKLPVRATTLGPCDLLSHAMIRSSDAKKKFSRCLWTLRKVKAETFVGPGLERVAPFVG